MDENEPEILTFIKVDPHSHEGTGVARECTDSEVLNGDRVLFG